MLKMELERRGLPTRGKKPDLVARLRTATAEVKPESKVKAEVEEKKVAAGVKPGLKGLGPMATAKVRALQCCY